MVTTLMIQTTPSQVAKKARGIAIDKAATQPPVDEARFRSPRTPTSTT